MSLEKRQRVLLAVLGVLVLVVVFRNLGGWLGGGPGFRPGGDDVALGRFGDPDELAVLDVEALAAESGSYRPGRDPFRFGAARPAAPERREAPPPEPPRPRTPPPEPAEERGPRLPEVTMRYLGNFGPDGERIAVFVDGDDIVNARVGEVLQGQFRLVSIGFESADLEYVDFPEAPPRRLAVGG